jgi:hypothetical protein
MTQAISRQTATRTRQSTFTIVWEIAAGAVQGFCASVPVRLELAVALPDGHGRVGPVEARLAQGETVRALDLADTTGVCITDAETGLTHVDVPGVLHVSFRPNEPARPLYARTAILDQLSVRGGTYELVGGSLTE